MAYTTCWRKLEDKWIKGKAFLLDKNKLHMEQYEFWHYEYEMVTKEVFDNTETSDTVEKIVYFIKAVPENIYYKIIRWYRHPNHWE